MSQPRITAITWEELNRAAYGLRYHHCNRLQRDIQALKWKYPSITPFVADIPGQSLLLFRADLPRNSRNQPVVQFVVTLTKEYPNSYPIITIEQPPEGWRIKRHPSVDNTGQCYLSTVTNWQPSNSNLEKVIEELHNIFSANNPFEEVSRSGGGGGGGGGGIGISVPVPQAPPVPAPPQQPAQPQPQQQQQPYGYMPGASQQQQQRSVGGGGGGGGAPSGTQIQRASTNNRGQEDDDEQQRELTPLQTVALGSLVAGALLVRGVGRAIDSVTGNTRDETGVSRSEERSQQQRRNRDMEWLEQQKQKEQTAKQAPRDMAAEREFSIMMDGVPKPSGTEIMPPVGFGLGKIKTGNPQGPLQIFDGAPRPLPAVTAPTPDEHHKQVVEEDYKARQDNMARASQQPQPKSILGKGFRGVAMAARFGVSLASDAKNAIENKVRESSTNHEARRFHAMFPANASTETLKAEYQAKSLCGDGTAMAGRIFITDQAVHFSTVEESAALNGGGQGQSTTPNLIFSCRLAYVVSLVKGNCLEHHWLHLVSADNTIRSFFAISTNVAHKIGAAMSTSLEGTPYDRAYNWIDHMWRVCAVVPNPSYEYGSGVTTGASTAGTPAATPVSTGGGGASTTPPPDPAEAAKCCVCLENAKNVFFQPCGHVCVCQECAEALDECPLCRTKITHRFQAFL